MWMLLIISYLDGKPLISTIPDLYNKEQCLEVIKVVKREMPQDSIEYKCLYVPDDDE